jgi:cAMP-dependent protein kinase regulator
MCLLNMCKTITSYCSLLQEQAHDAKQQAVSPEDTDDLSPLPSAVQQPARRRGGISAEPVSEEDATSYVKKVPKFCVQCRNQGKYAAASI